MIDSYKIGLGGNTIYLNKLPYQMICVAKDSGTGEEMAVYQALHGEFECFVKPFQSFLKEWNDGELLTEDAPADAEAPRQEASGNADDSQEGANPVLLEFLDADTLEQKYQILKRLGNSITDRLIDDFAVVLDLVIPEGALDYRYQQLLNSVRTMQQYENTRFLR